MFFRIIRWLLSVQRTRVLKKLHNKEEILQTIRRGIGSTFYFCSNSGYYFLSSELGMIRNVFKNPRFQMTITSNLEQRELLLLYFIGTVNIQKKAIEAGSVTSPRNRFPIHLSNYRWAGINNFVCSTILVITELYIFLFFASVLLLIKWTSTAAFYYCWSYMEHSALYIFDINIVWPYEICEFIWFLIW